MNILNKLFGHYSETDILNARHNERIDCMKQYDTEQKNRDKEIRAEKEASLERLSGDYEEKLKENKLFYEKEIEGLRGKTEFLKKENEIMRREYMNFKILRDKLEMVTRRSTEFVSSFNNKANKALARIYQDAAMIEYEAVEELNETEKSMKFKKINQEILSEGENERD